MKYLLTILAIVLAVTALTIFSFWPEKATEPQDILVTVNGHAIPKSVLEQKKYLSSYHSKDDQAILDTIIINELLLQEAQRLGIDKEPAFRAAVQEYYEQSLIKILIDRQFSKMDIAATDQEVDRYIANHGKVFTFTRLPATGTENPGQTARQKSVLFDDLSDSLKLLLGNMNEGEVVTDFYTGNELISFRLDKIEPGPDRGPFYENRESVRKKITNYKKEKALRSWIKKLRDQADITTPEGKRKP